MKKTARNLGGRPQSAARSELTAAQIARQDAISRRTARRITGILDTFVPLSLVCSESARAARILRARMERVPGEVADAVATARDAAAVGRVLDAALRTALQDVSAAYSSAADRPAPWPDDPLFVRPPARLRPSADLASARARGARLAAQLIELRGRCERPPGRGEKE